MNAIETMIWKEIPTPSVMKQAKHYAQFRTWSAWIVGAFVLVAANRLISLMRIGETDEAWITFGESISVLLAPMLLDLLCWPLRRFVVQKICPGYRSDLVEMLEGKQRKASTFIETPAGTLLLIGCIAFACLFPQSGDIFALSCWMLLAAELFLVVAVISTVLDDMWTAIKVAMTNFNNDLVYDFLKEIREQSVEAIATEGDGTTDVAQAIEPDAGKVSDQANVTDEKSNP